MLDKLEPKDWLELNAKLQKKNFDFSRMPWKSVSG